MKQAKFIFILAAMVALSVGFSSCNNDDDSLVGTTWVSTQNSGSSGTETLRFRTETRGTITETWTDSDGESDSVTVPFTYTFNAPTVTITIDTAYLYGDPGNPAVITGTVSGSRMTFRSEDGGTIVFIRQ